MMKPRFLLCCLTALASATSWISAAPLAVNTSQGGAPLELTREGNASGLLPLSADNATSDVYGRLRVKQPAGILSPYSAHSADNTDSTAPMKAALKGSPAANMPAIYGSVVGANSWTVAMQAQKTGMYRIPTSSEDEFEVVSVGSTAPRAANGGAMVADTYYAFYEQTTFWTSYYITDYDTDTWERKSRITSSKGCMALDLAYDPTNGKTYGCFLKESGQGYVLGTINLTTFSVSQIRQLSAPYVALATAADGTLYGIMSESDPVSGAVTASKLYRIDKLSGGSTLVGITGCLPYYNSSAIIDPTSGRMFWTVASADKLSALYEVSLETGKATKLCDFPDGEQVCGLWIDTPEAAPGAPAAVSDIAGNFPEGALTGTITFNAPSTLFDGTPATGELDYQVIHGSTILAQGKTSYGEPTSAQVTVGQSGIYGLTVTVSNEAGTSPAQTLELYIGKDTPALPQVTASYSDGIMHVQWTAVTESQNGGYVNPEEITYRVVRHPSMVVSAQSTKETHLDEPVDEPDRLSEFYYTVEAMWSGGTSGEAESNKVVLGAILPPYSNGFNTPESLEYWEILDINEDDKTWAFQSSEGTVAIGFNKNLPMDDWLITPPLRLEEGKAYRMTIEARTMSTDEETFEVKLGSLPTPEGMTIDVIPATTFKNTSYQQFEGYLVAPTSGKYHLGIHACSEAYTYRLYIKNLEIQAGESAAGPGAPTGFQAIPDPDGAYRATLKVTAPDIDFNGEPIDNLSKLELLRGDVVIKSFDNPEPGKEYDFTDELGASGDVEYTAVASNKFGRGKPAMTSLFVGINQPAAPINVNLVETDNEGEVKMTWDAVSTDYRGYPLNPQLVRYTIWQLKAETHVVLFDGIEDTEYTFQAVEPGDQKMVHYYVSAEAGEKLSPVVDSPLIHCGTPYALPFEETFKGPGTDSWMGISEEGTSTWNVYSDRDVAGLQSVTSDNGFLGSKGKAVGDYSSVYTGKIAIPADFVKPGLMFYTYNICNDGINDDNEIEVSVCDLTAGDSDYTKIHTVKISDLSDTPGWVLASVPLDAYKGHTIQIDLKTVVVNYPLTFIDDISINRLTEKDLKVKAVESPSEAFANREFAISAIIENRGTKSVESFTAILTRNGAEEAKTTVDTPVHPNGIAAVTFNQQFNALQTEGATYKIEVVLEGDENPADNIAEDIVVAFKEMPLPAVDDLTATYESENAPVILRWSEPDASEYSPLPITDDFESYESWAEEGVGDWTFVDVDGKPVGKISDVTLPNIEWLAPHSWWVMDASLESLNASFTAASGNKYLAQMYAVSDTQATSAWPCDDWIISPELTGDAQTISFYARSYSANYTESFEVLWSDGATDPDEFSLIDSRAQIPAQWVKYDFVLPEGARRFAIRATSFNRFMLFIDDITYTPLSEKDIHLAGYNVWRDGILLTANPVTDTEFTDGTSEGLAHSSKYLVTAVYDKGESGRSNEAIPSMQSSINRVQAMAVTITAIDNIVRIEGAIGKNILVTTPDGRVVYSEMATSDDTRITVPAGVVIVSAAGKTAKILVK